MFNVMDKWRYVHKFKSGKNINYEDLKEVLWQAWKTTPSKNSFMPYSIHVIGPNQPELKQIVYNTAAEKEFLSNERNSLHENEWPVNVCKETILNAEYVIVFTSRLEDEPSLWQLHLHRGGCYMDAWSIYEDNIEDYLSTIYVEVGLFARAVNALLLNKGIDSNYIISFDKKSKQWNKLPFIKMEPCLIMPVGVGEVFRRDEMSELHSEWDVKPDFERIVNFHV